LFKRFLAYSQKYSLIPPKLLIIPSDLNSVSGEQARADDSGADTASKDT
jgi:hypothetical protein